MRYARGRTHSGNICTHIYAKKDIHDYTRRYTAEDCVEFDNHQYGLPDVCNDIYRALFVQIITNGVIVVVARTGLGVVVVKARNTTSATNAGTHMDNRRKYNVVVRAIFNQPGASSANFDNFPGDCKYVEPLEFFFKYIMCNYLHTS